MTTEYSYHYDHDFTANDIAQQPPSVRPVMNAVKQLEQRVRCLELQVLHLARLAGEEARDSGDDGGCATDRF